MSEFWITKTITFLVSLRIRVLFVSLFFFIIINDSFIFIFFVIVVDIFFRVFISTALISALLIKKNLKICKINMWNVDINGIKIKSFYFAKSIIASSLHYLRRHPRQHQCRPHYPANPNRHLFHYCICQLLRILISNYVNLISIVIIKIRFKL